MSKWSEIEFDYESETYGLLKVSLSAYASGSHEEPMLEQDGDLTIEKVLSGSEPALICTQEKRIESSAHGDIHHMAKYERNPKYHSHEIPLTDFPLDEQRAIEGAVELHLDETCEAYADDIGQSITESASDAMYESWKDRDHE